MSQGRARLSQAERKQRNLKLRWDPRDVSWMQFARCFVCRRTFCVNNFPDKHARIPRVFQKIVCPFCNHHPEIKYIVRAMESHAELHPKQAAKHRARKHPSLSGGPE